MKRIISIVLLLLIAISLAGCGSSNKDASYEMVTESASMNDYSASYSGFSAVSNTADAIEPKYEESSGGESQDTELRPEKIIYNGNATVETTEFDTAIESLKKLVEDNDGFIESSSIQGSSYSSSGNGTRDNRYADYTIRIPSEKFDSVMNALSTIGNVPRNEVYTENISSQYYDAQARLKSYQATEERLLELLDKAENVSDIIEIEKELSEVRYNIESVQSTIKGWDNRVSYSTISIYLKEVSEYTPIEKTGFFYDLLQAIKNGFSNLGDFVLLLVEALPVVLVIAAAVFGIVKLVKKICIKRKEKKQSENKE